MFDLSFYDDNGHTLLTVQQTPGGFLDVRALPTGIIFMRIHAEDKYKVDKTVKILKLR